MSRMHILKKKVNQRLTESSNDFMLMRERERKRETFLLRDMNVLKSTLCPLQCWPNIWHWFFFKMHVSPVCKYNVYIYSLLSQLVPMYPGLHIHMPFTLLQLCELACTHLQVDEQFFPNLKMEHAMEYKNQLQPTCHSCLQSVKDPNDLFIKLYSFKNLKFYRTENWTGSEIKSCTSKITQFFNLLLYLVHG